MGFGQGLYPGIIRMIIMTQAYEAPDANVILFAPMERIANYEENRTRDGVIPADDGGFDGGVDLESSIFG